MHRPTPAGVGSLDRSSQRHTTTMSIAGRPKILVMGDPAVGKSAITKMFHSGGQTFLKAYNMTCGAEFCKKEVAVAGTNDTVELHIFDTAGQDVFAEMMPSFWEGARGVILVYDVTRRHTVDACLEWYSRLLQTLQVPHIPGVVVANKTDLRERLVVSRQQGQQMAGSLNMQYFETSALEGTSVDEPFVAIGKLIHEQEHGDGP